MKKVVLLLVILVLGMSAPAISAQNATEERDMQKFLSEMRGYKHDYLVKALNLNREQKDRFFEVYDKMDDEISRLNYETRNLERKIYEAPDGTISDTEYEAATQAILELKGKECEIEKTYYEQLKPILTKKQLFELRKAERDFSMKMMRQHNKLKRDKKQ